MSYSIAPRRLAIWSLTAATFCASQGVMAHTVIRDKGKENTTLYTAAVITHGCAAGEGGTPIPVIAQSVVFPNNADSILTRLDTSATVQLSDVIDGASPVLAISPNGIQDKNVFKRQKEIADFGVLVGQHSVPNVRAFRYWNGKLQTDLQGVLPFSVSGIAFKPSSCAKNLLVRIAIANWCTTSQSAEDDNRVDAWLGHTTPLFSDEGVVSVGFWPTLTISRDLATNPLPAACGQGYDVAIEPSDADIDAYLPIQGYWPRQ